LAVVTTLWVTADADRGPAGDRPASGPPAAGPPAAPAATPGGLRTPSPAAATPPPAGPGQRPHGGVPPAVGPPASGTPLAVAPSAAPEDLLRRQNPRPDGVPAQLNFYLGGGGACPYEGESGRRPRVYGAPRYVEVLDLDAICFDGFDPSRPLAVTVVPPAGRPIENSLNRTGEAAEFTLPFRPVPGDPLGPYQVMAVQDDLTAHGEFTLRAASVPRLLVEGGRHLVPGIEIPVYLAGFPPGEPAVLHLYDSNGYRTSFTVPVDADGVGVAVVNTVHAQPQTCYGIISLRAHRQSAREPFCFGDAY
jgi:hypothetical protein